MNVKNAYLIFDYKSENRIINITNIQNWKYENHEYQSQHQLKSRVAEKTVNTPCKRALWKKSRFERAKPIFKMLLGLINWKHVFKEF